MLPRYALLFASCLTSTSVFALDSDLDPDFGIFSTGRNVIAINQGGNDTDLVADVLTAADGSLYLVGTAVDVSGGQSRITLVHLKPDGTVDLDFGADGRFVAPGNTFDTRASAAAFDANGNILVAGYRQFAGNDTDFIVCKFSGDSTAMFSATGAPCVTVAIDQGGWNQDRASDLTILDDGRIALAGWAAASATTGKLAIAMINPDGLLDTGFNSDGKLYSLDPEMKRQEIHAIVQAGGYLFAVGGSTHADDTRFANWTLVDADVGTILDHNFNLLGSGSGPAYYRDVIKLHDGMVAAVGGVMTDNDEIQGAVVRIGADGYPSGDGGWGGGDGIAMLDSGSQIELTRLVAQTDGKLLVAGTRYPTNGTSSELFVGRVDASGNLDLVDFHFGFGYRAVDFQMPGSFDTHAALTLQGGRPVLAGSVEADGFNLGDYDFGVARLQSDLIFRAGFGAGND